MSQYVMAEDQLLTPEEAAVYLKKHVGSIRRLLRTGALPGAKFGGGWRISKASLDALAKGVREAGPGRGSEHVS